MQTETPTTWEDVLRMPDDGNRYEFIGGRLYVTPLPVTRRQRISKRLQAGQVDLDQVFSRHPDRWETRDE